MVLQFSERNTEPLILRFQFFSLSPFVSSAEHMEKLINLLCSLIRCTKNIGCSPSFYLPCLNSIMGLNIHEALNLAKLYIFTLGCLS